MLQSSKLSNRFKKVEKKEIKIPAKLSFPHKKMSDNNSTELENYNKTVVETSPLIEDEDRYIVCIRWNFIKEDIINLFYNKHFTFYSQFDRI